MPRPKQCRMVKCPPKTREFRPYVTAQESRGESMLHYDEFEAIRLIDYEGLSQAEAARQMQISRPTFTRIYDSALKVVADTLINGKILRIEAGNVEFYGNWHSNLNNINMISNSKSNRMKKIAIPSCDGILFPHFGQAPQVTFVTIEEGKVVKKEEIAAPPHEHGSMPKFMAENEAHEVIAGGLGGDALELLSSCGIDVHIGAPVLPVDELVSQYLAGSLIFNGNVCAGHGYHHEAHGNDERCR